MFRNQYDTDVTVWSPQGRLHQVEYALEAVKQGACALGLRSKDFVVLAALKRSANELSSYQKKIFKIASYDQTGPHLFQTDPSGAYYEYVAQAIGSRAQSGKTYLEKYYAEFEELGVDDLIKHALKALSGTTGDKELDKDNASVAVVGKDHPLQIIEGEALQKYLDAIEVEGNAGGAAAGGEAMELASEGENMSTS
eukprot:evm.model.NODE_22739_length_5049_cov_18.659536.2